MNKYNDFKSILYRLIFVPTCASCGERLPAIVDKTALNHGYSCLCDACMLKWQEAKNGMCHNCYKVASKCTCMPLKNTFAQPEIPSLFFYHPDVTRVESKMIYTMKHKKNRELFLFLAKELTPSLLGTLEVLEIPVSECIFTYIPRTKSALRENGFDQGKIFAKALCAASGGCDMLPLLTREGGKEQKRLSKKERQKNVDAAIFANTAMIGFDRAKCDSNLKSVLSGKTIILVDDIITTGSSISRAIKLLRSLGAKNVVVCAAARSEISHKNLK